MENNKTTALVVAKAAKYWAIAAENLFEIISKQMETIEVSASEKFDNDHNLLVAKADYAKCKSDLLYAVKEWLDDEQPEDDNSYW